MFGMGTGGTLRLLSPEILCSARSVLALCFASARYSLLLSLALPSAQLPFCFHSTFAWLSLSTLCASAPSKLHRKVLTTG